MPSKPPKRNRLIMMHRLEASKYWRGETLRNISLLTCPLFDLSTLEIAYSYVHPADPILALLIKHMLPINVHDAYMYL